MRNPNLALWSVVGSLVVAANAWGFAKAPSSEQPPLETVSDVQLDRYLGTWYEIATIPQWFEKDCYGSTATYSMNDDGSIDVLNECRKGSLQGDLDSVHGTAKVVDERSHAKLKVTFFWPFSGDYWIIELGKDYEYSVVSSPDRSTFWILSRTPSVDTGVLQGILNRAKAQGIDLSALRMTPQAQ